MPYRGLQGVAMLVAQGRDGQASILDVLLRAVPAAIVVTDREMKVLAASVKWLREMSRAEADVLGRSLYEISPDYFPQFRESYDRCLAGETVLDPMFNSPRGGDGGEWWRTEVTPWRDADGEVGGTISVSMDITDMVQAMSRVEESEQRLQMAVELADVHVWEMDYRSGAMMTAGAAESFFDGSLDPDEIARDTNLTIHPEDRAQIAVEWERAMIEDLPFRPEYRINRQDGKEVWAACTTRLVRSDAGEPIRLIGAMQNITGRKQAETALRQAKEEAEAANVAKSRFLATMSHEIRTPLNGVLGMAQAMANDRLSKRQRGRLETVRQSGEALLAILNDVLDLSKIEAGKLELEDAEFSLAGLMEEVRATFSGVAASKAVAFEVEIAPATAGIYRGDAARLRQVLNNLASNALKFTDQGGVRLRAMREAGRLVLEVADSGIGIPADRLPRLFSKFEQADASTTRRYGGTGLGLAICRELVQLMGGEIGARSTPGEGSTFRVEVDLPYLGAEVATATRATEVAAAAPEAGLRVLAAEDNAVNQTVLRTLLQQIGIEPVVVANGVEAVAAYTQERWDLILMDVEMPELDGPSATRAIRRLEAQTGAPRIPIVALTANAMAHQVREYMAAGMDAFVSKPIRIADLFGCMQQVLETPAESQTGLDRCGS